MQSHRERRQIGSGSLELIVLGLLAALVVVLAIPVFDSGYRESSTPVTTEK